ncbi:MAG: TRAP transporter small permease [Deltaproteobacteria bacterium]|nr:TRAP transporter small permease [Deltaproteobacteria bacterium]
MNTLLRAVTRFDDSLGKLEAGVLIALVATMTITVFLQVIYRYVLTQSLSWSEELARYLFAWISLLGAALAVKKRGHFGLELFYEMLSRRGRRSLGFTLHLLMGAVILVILVQGCVLSRCW